MLGRVFGGMVEMRSRGARLWTDAGEEYLNCGGYGVFLLGAGHPAVVDAVSRQLHRHPVASRVLLESTVAEAAARGVELKWFGASEPAGFTSNHGSWRYLREQSLLRTDAVLSTLFDMRLPLTFTPADCDAIAHHLDAALAALRSPEGAA